MAISYEATRTQQIEYEATSRALEAMFPSPLTKALAMSIEVNNQIVLQNAKADHLKKLVEAAVKIHEAQPTITMEDALKLAKAAEVV